MMVIPFFVPVSGFFVLGLSQALSFVAQSDAIPIPLDDR
jgi:hypothetical protein